MTRILIIALTLSLSGCSVLITESHRDNYNPQRHGPPRCTTNGTPPAVDVILAVLNIGAGVVYLANANDAENEGEVKIAGAATLAWGLGHTLSSVHGFNSTNDCKTADREYLEYRVSHGKE